jgi:hypothetical protein
MKNKKLKSESHGTQQQTWAGGAGAGSNFQHGKDLGTHTRGSLGTRGGDSNFSRRTQRIMPIDYFDARHAAESDKDCDGEDWATGYCPGEELDEDYVVENSKYSLSSVLIISEVDVLDMTPDDSGMYGFDPNSFDPSALARTERTATSIGLEFGADGISSLMNFVAPPVVNEFLTLGKIAKNILELKKSAELILDLDEKFKKEIEVLTNQEMISDRKKYINIFSSGIKEIEEIQADMYVDLGDLAKALVELVPNEYIAGAATTAVGGVPGTVVGTVIGKTAETFAAGSAGTSMQLLVKKFVQDFEQEALESHDFVDTDIGFETWLKQSDDPNSKALKFIIFMLRVGEGPFSGLGKHIPTYANPTRIFRALFVGAKMQNILIQKIRNLQDQNFVDTHTREYGEASTEKPEGIPGVDYQDGEATGNETTSASTEFFRKLFFKDQGDQGMFSESLDNQSLLYLIEDIDSELDEDIDSELDEDDMNEFSGAGGAGGVSLPLGMSTKGPKGNTSANSGGAAWPYSKKQQAAFKKYSKKSFGGK